ncbi:GDSL esterase/lipase At1g71250-like [Tasmannia lanceolata]|uniref:GDSL esterase/lipase At1g71250-like n=1 Tax=Tasmannia lanceolata TaxID=3420 RepID=UPI004062A34B
MEKLRSGHANGARFSCWVVVIFVFLQCSIMGVGSTQIPAIFVFGDSLVDDGNNNYLNSLAKANYPPYGIDFFRGPTGRFCNGRTAVDWLCEMLGLPYPPPYADPNSNGKRILSGVNYASAAGGILEETGRYFVERFSLNQQVLNFESNLDDLRNQMGGRNLSEYLAKSIAVMVLGSNDYINNYLVLPLYNTSLVYTPQAYANLLLNHYSRQLSALFSVGLRKFVLAGVGPLGCIPNQLARGLAPPGQCVDYVNQIVGLFNVGLRSLVDKLNHNHPGAMFVYGNTYGVFGDILNNPSAYGFSVSDRGCCGLGRNEGQITCLPLSLPCPDRNQYVFWDAFHPTQAANAILARRAFSGGPKDCYPINVQQMALI